MLFYKYSFSKVKQHLRLMLSHESMQGNNKNLDPTMTSASFKQNNNLSTLQ